jgi:hypothetical protein
MVIDSALADESPAGRAPGRHHQPYRAQPPVEEIASNGDCCAVVQQGDAEARRVRPASRKAELKAQQLRSY